MRRISLRGRRLLVAMTAAGLLIRIAWAVRVPLLEGEAYHWVWSKMLALSYLDHPPFIAYMIRLTTLISDAEVWVRMGPLLAGIVTQLALFTLGREIFDERAGLIAVALYQVVPLLSAGGLWAIPETPLFLWWSLALVCVRRALSGTPQWWIPAGVAIGLGMLSKFTMIMLPVGILGFALTRRRDALRQPWAYAGAAIAVALFAPVLIWNAGNGWATLRFDLYERPQQLPTGLPGLLEIMVEQLGFTLVMLPVLLWVIAAALRRRNERLAFLLWMGLPTLVMVATVVALWGGAHGHWFGPAYLVLAVALGGLWPGRVAARAMAINAAFIVYAALIPFVQWLPVPPGLVESVAGWRDAAARAEALAVELPQPVIIAVDRWEAAAHLSYYTRRRRPVTVFPRPYEGSVWPKPSQYAGASAVWVSVSQWGPVAKPERFFSNITEREPLTIVMRGREVLRFRFWTGTGLRP